MTTCPDCGTDHHPELAEAAAELGSAEVVAEGVAGAAHEEARADVEVARIEGETAVELAKLDIKREEIWQETRVAELEGQVSGMREILDRLTAPPEPPPAPEPEPEPEIADDGPPPPDDKPAPAPPAPKKSKGWWG
ncbi:MAG TPA: hypothetical protein VKU39_11310 [Streptosporangiaceae bacterium]|nr:hypothetical protein [Streptosporangiaceae bacterium]